MEISFKAKLLNRTFQFSLSVIRFISNLSKNNINQVIGNQLLRSGLSIGANLAEGQGSSSKMEFKNFMQIAYKSTIETRYWLALLEKSAGNNKTLEALITEAKELSKILSSILLTIKGKKNS